MSYIKGKSNYSGEVDELTLDTMIVGKKETLSEGRRWLLISAGNGEFYELICCDPDLYSLANRLKANILLFNYPGVGASQGTVNATTLGKAYHAMLRLLEDKEEGIGAKEIIGYGHSLGGGVQAEGLNIHKLDPNIRYVFLKSRTFSTVGDEAGSFLTGISCLGATLSLLNLNLDCVSSSKKLKCREIILQTTTDNKYVELTPESDLKKLLPDRDPVITREATLVKALLTDPGCPKESKRIIGIPQDHNGGFPSINFLTNLIEEEIQKDV